MLRSLVLLVLVTGAASADSARSTATLAGGTSGYLAAYADVTAPCTGGSIDNPGTCTTTAQPRAVVVDDQGHVTSGPFDVGASAGTYHAMGNVVFAGDAGWLVDAGSSPRFVDQSGSSTVASPALDADAAGTGDYAQWVFVGDGWWCPRVDAPVLEHLALDGSRLATVTVGPPSTMIDRVALGVRPDGTMLVAWATDDLFVVQRFTKAGVAIDAGTLLGPASHARDLRVTATTAGWLVYTQADDGLTLTFVATDGQQLAHSIPGGATTQLAVATPDGALWVELVGSTLEVTDIGAYGLGIGAPPTTVTTLDSLASIASDGRGFVLLEQDTDKSLTFTALDLHGALVGQQQLGESGCSAAPGSTSGASCVIALALLAYAIARRQTMLPPAGNAQRSAPTRVPSHDVTR